MNLRSAAPIHPQCVDARYLNLEAEFFQLDRQQVDELMLLFAQWCEDVLGEQCVIQWHFNGRTCKSESIPQKIANCDVYDYCVEGYVKSETVFDGKSMSQFNKKLYHSPLAQKNLRLSSDYNEVFQKYFSVPPLTEEAWKSSLLGIFYEPGRVKNSTVFYDDFFASASMCPHLRCPDHYHGRLCFQILNYSLNGHASVLASQMADFLVVLSNRFVNLNARVNLSPSGGVWSCSAHMAYFGSTTPSMRFDMPDTFQLSEWANAAYLPGAEWFNIVSPTAQIHVPGLLEKACDFPTIRVVQLSGGGICVRLEQELIYVDVPDLLPSKLLLYDTLVPGELRIPMKAILDQKNGWRPREQWELVPILKEEINISDDHILFRHVDLLECMQHKKLV